MLGLQAQHGQVVEVRAFAEHLARLCRDLDAALLQALDGITAQTPLCYMQTPGSHTMTVATTNCGPLGWVSDPRGYRYAAADPHAGQRWPAMPPCFADLA